MKKSQLKEEIHDKELLIDSAVGELRFANMQIEALYQALDEISTITTDPVTKKVAEMAKERHQTDKIIHTRSLFE